MQCGITMLLSLWHVRKTPESIWEPVHYLAIHYMTIFDAKFLRTISKSNFNGSIFPDSAISTFIPLVTGWSYVIFFQYLCFIQSLPLLKTLFILITSVKATGPLWPATHSLSYYTVCFWVVVSTIAYSVGVWFAHVPFAVCHFPFTRLNPMLCEFRISVHLSLEQEQGKCVAGRGAATRRSYVKQQDSQFYSQMVLFWDSTLSV